MFVKNTVRLSIGPIRYTPPGRSLGREKSNPFPGRSCVLDESVGIDLPISHNTVMIFPADIAGVFDHPLRRPLSLINPTQGARYAGADM